MTIMKRLADILLYVAALLLLAACTDDADVYNTPAASKGNLCVYVPVTRGDDGNSQSDIASGNPTYNATVDECQVNDLWLYAFPQDGDGTLLSQQLTAPSAANMLNENVATYQLQIQPGTYRVYVVANMNSVLEQDDITTEDDLKNVVLGYQPPQQPGMPSAKNLPMIYEPATLNADGTATDGTTKVTANDKQPAVVTANLRFTCVKVRLNLIYDPNDADMDATMKASGLSINKILGEKLSPSTKLVWNRKFTDSDITSDYAEGFESTLYDAAAASGDGKFFSSWEENAANANVNDKDIITVADGDGTPRPVDNKQKWLFRATYYLPERYVAHAAQQSALKIEGSVGGNFDNSYNISLGHKNNEADASEVPTFPRSTYYEIVGRIKTMGSINLDCIVGVKDWEPMTVEADFMHTTLWVSQTAASVTSLQSAYIDYKTNETDLSKIEFGCDSKLNGNDIIILAKHDMVNHRIFFQVNQDIPISAYGSQTSGTAKAWIKVNNLKKYIDVEYDVEPLFKVSPVDITIFYDKDDQTENKKVVTFTTNLGGLAFPEGWSSGKVLSAGHNGASQIKIEYSNTAVAYGTFTVTAITDPGTTTVHTFTVTSLDGSKSQEIRVTVKQKFGPYRIYMRAINDLVWGIGGETTSDEGKDNQFSWTDQQLESDKLGSNNPNWRDGWQSSGPWTDEVKSGVHYAYIYTQIGETDNWQDTDKQPVWLFTAGFPGDELMADLSNPGWFYVTKSELMTQTGKLNNAQGDKQITPGQTLVIFSNNTNVSGGGYTRHRFTHHLDAGMTLFNFEDHEGWYVYDPTTEPYYKVYDDKPEIVDIKYVVYTRNKVTGWYHNYGVRNGVQPYTHYTVYSTTYKDGHFTSVQDGGWWKTEIWLKAPKDDNEKAIRLNLQNSSDEPTLNNGAPFETMTKSGSFYVVKTTYDNGKWTEGDHR